MRGASNTPWFGSAQPRKGPHNPPDPSRQQIALHPVGASPNKFLPSGWFRPAISAHQGIEAASLQIDHRLQLFVRNSIKKGKCRPRDAFE